MSKPKFKEYQFALIVADGATGTVYNTDLEIIS